MSTDDVSTDLETRLRNWHASYYAEVGPDDELMVEFLSDVMKAADELAVLKAKLARAKEALRDAGKAGRLLLANTIASIKKYQDPAFDENDLPGWLKDTEEKLRRAVAVLKELELP